MQLCFKILTILDGKLLNTNLSIRHISTSISFLKDLFNEMPLVSRLSAFNSLELFTVVEPSKHIFFSLGTHIVYLRFLEVLFRLVNLRKLLLELLCIVVSCISKSIDPIYLMLKLLCFFVSLELNVLDMLFLLLPHFDVFLMMLQDNLVHGVIFHFLLQFGFVS